MRLTYRQLPTTAVLYARAVGPYQRGTSEAWRIMGAWLDAHNARRHMKVSWGVFRDNPRTTAPELLRYDACIPLIPEIELDPASGVRRQTIPGGAYAVHTHVGPIEATDEIFSRLHREVAPSRGLTVDYERAFLATYLTDPTVTRAVHRRTEICVPVNPIRMLLPSNDAGEEAAIDATTCLRFARSASG